MGARPTPCSCSGPKSSICRTFIKWFWSWARARSGSCSHYFSWRYLAVIDTRFLACAHYQGEASRPLLPPLENVLTSHTDSFHEIKKFSKALSYMALSCTDLADARFSNWVQKSLRYTILGLRSLSGRGITTATPTARKCPYAGSSHKFISGFNLQ